MTTGPFVCQSAVILRCEWKNIHVFYVVGSIRSLQMYVIFIINMHNIRNVVQLLLTKSYPRPPLNKNTHTRTCKTNTYTYKHTPWTQHTRCISGKIARLRANRKLRRFRRSWTGRAPMESRYRIGRWSVDVLARRSLYGRISRWALSHISIPYTHTHKHNHTIAHLHTYTNKHTTLSNHTWSCFRTPASSIPMPHTLPKPQHSTG